MSRWPSPSSGTEYSPGLLDRAETFDGSHGETVSTTTDAVVKGGSVTFKKAVRDIETFEDNDITPGNDNWSGWNGDTGKLSAQSNTVLEGSYTGELYTNDANGYLDIQRDTEAQPTHVEWRTRSSSTFADNRKFYFELSGSDGTFATVSFDGTDQIVVVNGTGTSQSWTSNTTYDVRVDIDWQNEEIEVTVNGSSYGPFAFQTSATGFNRFDWVNKSTFMGASTYLDGLRYDVGESLSASATVEWPMPDDLADWDIAPFQYTPDGGTVDVYVIDASDGTRLAGPVEEPADLSRFSNSTNLAFEVELSRSNSDQMPSLDAIYRRRKVT